MLPFRHCVHNPQMPNAGLPGLPGQLRIRSATLRACVRKESMEIDFGLTAADYTRHRAGFPEALFERLSGFGLGAPGQRVLDVGSGTGALARGFARRGCQVVATDISAALLRAGAARDPSDGSWYARVVGAAEHIPAAAGAFEVFAAGQCWHWFDRPAAAAEARRMLAPGGWLVIAHFDWIPLPGNVVAATEDLIRRYNPRWTMHGGAGLYPAWLADAAGAGFVDLETFSFDVAQPYSHAAWRGRIRASAGIAASLAEEAVAAFDRDHAAMLARNFSGDPLLVPHRVWALVGRAPRL